MDISVISNVETLQSKNNLLFLSIISIIVALLHLSNSSMEKVILKYSDMFFKSFNSWRSFNSSVTILFNSRDNSSLLLEEIFPLNCNPVFIIPIPALKSIDELADISEVVDSKYLFVFVISISKYCSCWWEISKNSSNFISSLAFLSKYSTFWYSSSIFFRKFKISTLFFWNRWNLLFWYLCCLFKRLNCSNKLLVWFDNSLHKL